MIEFSIKLAEIPIKVRSAYSYARYFCRDYITQEQTQFEVTITPEEIEKTRAECYANCIREGKETFNHTDLYLESLALLHLVADAFFEYDILLFHGSAVALDGKAYLFAARSGVGKTTHSKLWLKNIPGAYILNGDKPFLLFKPDGIYVCGNPWRGKECYGRNEILPLAGICILERALENHIESISYRDAFEVLTFQSHKPPQDARLVTFMKLLGRLSSIPLYRMGCNMEDEAALVSFRGMVKQ